MTTTTWDIIDTVQPGLEITETDPRGPQRRLPTPATSTLKAVFFIGVGVVAFGSGPTLVQPYSAGSISAVTQIARAPQALKVKYSRSDSETDTQRGMSSPKLAERFAAYFVPAEDEEDTGEAYNYGG